MSTVISTAIEVAEVLGEITFAIFFLTTLIVGAIWYGDWLNNQLP